jgi:hypothetical protein
MAAGLNPKPETRNPEPLTPEHTLSTLNPGTLNPKLKTLNTPGVGFAIAAGRVRTCVYIYMFINTYAHT